MPIGFGSAPRQEVEQRARVHGANGSGAVELGRQQVHHAFGEVGQRAVDVMQERHMAQRPPGQRAELGPGLGDHPVRRALVHHQLGHLLGLPPARSRT